MVTDVVFVFVGPAARMSVWEFFGHKLREIDGNGLILHAY